MLKLALHMVLSDPEITVDLMSQSELSQKTLETKQFEKDKYLCLDGFPKAGNPCLVVMEAPK